jgi:hypothetical protein
MIVHCNLLVHMAIVDDATNNVAASALRTVSIEYNIIPTRIHQRYSQMYTNWDSNRLSCHQYVIRWLFTLTHLSVW